MAENTPHKTRIAKALQELKPNVSAQDRLDAQAELKLDKATISRYLNGKGGDLDTGLQLLTFLRPKVQSREEKIA